MRTPRSLALVLTLSAASWLLWAQPAHAATVLTKSLFSSGGARSSSGSVSLSSNIGDAISGLANQSTTNHWAGFYGPFLPSLVDVVPEPPVALVTYLAHATPNPARGSAIIEFGNAVRQDVQLSLYDVSGRRVRLLHAGDLRAGVYHMSWDLRDDAGQAVSAGIYFVRFISSQFQGTVRMAVVR